MATAGPRIYSNFSNKLTSEEEGIPYVPKKTSNFFPTYNPTAPPKDEYEAVFRNPPPVGNSQPLQGIVPKMPKALKVRHTIKNFKSASTKGGRRKMRKIRKTKIKAKKRN